MNIQFKIRLISERANRILWQLRLPTTIGPRETLLLS
jgi:hypothetical protein